MKLSIILVAVLGYSVLCLTDAAQKQTAKPAAPPPKPSPTAAAVPAAKQTPPARTAPAPTPIVATPAATPNPITAASGSPTATPAVAPAAAGTKEPCEDKVQASGVPLCSKVQPKTSVLDKDAILNRSYKRPTAPDKPIVSVWFTHETHATLKYSIEGTKVIGCAECHHTDQPKAALTGVLKTSERDTVLTAASLTAPNAKAVKSCRACHAQEGATPVFWPANPQVTYPDEPDTPVVLTNYEAYHRNCITCHGDAVIARKKPGAPAFLKGTPPTGCAGCHTGKTQ